MIRPARPDDLDAAYELEAARAAQVDEEASRPLFEAAWRRGGDSRLVLERDGAVVGLAVLRAGGDVTVLGETDGLLAAVEQHARERGDERLEAVVSTLDAVALDDYAMAGWTRKRDVWRMWLELDDKPPAASLPKGVAVRTYEAADARRLHAFVVLAFAENNERVLPFDDWLAFMTDHSDFDPAFWHLAEAGGDLVACALCWAPFERKGWVMELAVHPERRGIGLGEAMLHVAARAYRDAGVERVGLKVDADNPTGAPRLYQRLGYVTDRVYAVFERPTRA